MLGALCISGRSSAQHLDNYYLTFRQPHFNMHTRCLGKIAISLYIICNICRPVSPAHYLSWLPLCLSAASRKILVINVLRAFRHLSRSFAAADVNFAIILSSLVRCFWFILHYAVCGKLLHYCILCCHRERVCIYIYREEPHKVYCKCSSHIKVWWIIFSEYYIYYIGELPGSDDCVTIRNWNEP